MNGIVKVQDGHLFETDEDGYMVDYGSDMHDGPSCVICGGAWCRNCSPEIFTEVCPGRAEPTLPGMEWRQPQITGITSRQVRR